MQQQVLMYAVCQQPQWHLEEPVTGEVGEPAQAGDEVLPGAAAVGQELVSGGGREQEVPQPSL